MVQGKMALMLIDMQNRLLGEGGVCWNSDEVLTTVAGLLERARAAGVPVIYVQDDDLGPEGSQPWSIHERVAPQPGELVVRKRACDAFYGTNLAVELQARGVQQLVVAGAKTEYCVDSALRRATTLGYNVILVGDGHTTSDTEVLPAAQVIAHANRLFDGFDNLANYALVQPAAEILFA